MQHSTTGKQWLVSTLAFVACLKVIRGIQGFCAKVSAKCELRIDHGRCYRVYFTKRGPVVIILLVGGDKRTQDADIERAIAIAKQWKD